MFKRQGQSGLGLAGVGAVLAEDRYMYLVLFFDLPTKTSGERKIANKFRKDLLRDGYFRLQLSCYSRICKGLEAVDKHVSRVRRFCPNKGSVRVLKVTDKQYGMMLTLIGEKKITERIAGEQILFF